MFFHWYIHSFIQYATQRASFDECVSQTLAGGAQRPLDGPCLCLLSRRLIFFYKQSVDVHRLVRMHRRSSTDSIQMVARMPKYMYLTHFISLCVQIWLCQNLVKFNNQFVKLLMGPQRQTCLFQIKRILGFCCRYSAKILIWVT